MFGSPLELQAKQITYNVYRFYKKRKMCKDTEEYINDINLVNKVSEITGMSSGTVQKIVKEAKTMESEYGTNAALFKPKPKYVKVVKKCPRKKRIVVDNILEGDIRRKAIKIGTLSKLCTLLKEENILQCSKEFLRKLLLKLNITTNSNSGKLEESIEVVTERQKYLEAVRSFREQDKPIFYLNEPKHWIHNNDNISLFKDIPSFVIVHISGYVGFLDETKLMLKMKPKSEDDVCFEHFENYDWIKDIVLRNISTRSVIVTNIPYCETPESMLEDKKPSTDSPKSSLTDWLKRHNIPYNENATPSELMELINNQDAKTEYSISKTIKESGHEILHLPQNHSDLNPVAIMWHDIKSNITKSSIANLFLSYPEKKWEDCLRQVKDNETEYYSYYDKIHDTKEIKKEIEEEDLKLVTCDNDNEDSMNTD